MAARKGKVKEEQAVVTLGPQVREGFLLFEALFHYVRRKRFWCCPHFRFI